ncbi:FtsX-like permease family protein [Streptomyces sp. NPDC057621]|uniref:ABC transporter permease n=1 Tax=Streptomyces sp. NPDC057621 TaxID=3346186 RepID=UPI0036C47C1F
MLRTALRTLRARWVTFVGSFVALSTGVALIAVMGLVLASSADAPDRGPERFAAAPVVVKGMDTLRVSTPNGVRTRALAQPRTVPEKLVARLRTLGTVVEDRSFPVRVRGGGRGGDGPGDLVGHPWSTAAFAPYELVAGRAPKAADEVAVSGDWARSGTRIRTYDGTVRVVGVVKAGGAEQHAGAAPDPSPAFENAVFHTDARAAELSPRSVQLVVAGADAAAVREAVRETAPASDGVQVLTGDARRYADADPDRDREAITAMNALFGTAGGVTGFVSVFVVASTFAFAVARRRREFGLLRTAGATPGQLRRMVVSEALLIGVLASAAGCVLGSYGAPRLAAWAVDEHLAPRWFTLGDHTWPYWTAFWTGLLVALSGALAASWRAGRTGPVEALREAAVDTGTMTWGRRLCGGGLLLTAVVLPVLALVADPGDLLHRKTYISRPMLLITAVALLAPVLVRPLARLIAWAPARLPGATGMLVRENAVAGVRRTAAVAAPVLVMVALTGSLSGAVATLHEAKAAEVRARTTADFVVTAPRGAGFDEGTLRRLRGVPGTEVSVTSSSAVYVLEDGVALIGSEARAVEPGPLTRTARLPLVAGDARDLDDDSIIVNEEWERHTVGQRVDVWLGDGTRKSLRIAAVMPTGTGDNGVYVTPRNAPKAYADRVDVHLTSADAHAHAGAHAGADAGAVTAAPAELRDAVRESGGKVFTAGQWVRARYPESDRTTRTGFVLVLGIALLYTGISLVNTVVMAASGRVRDLAVLRLAGATRWQVLRMVGAEALTVVVVGGVLGLLVAGFNLLGMWSALRLLSVRTSVEMPWAALGATAGACAVLAVVSSVMAAALVMRRRAVE